MFKNLFRNIRKKEESKGNSENLLKEKQAQSKSLSEDNEAGNYESEVDGNIISKEDTGNIGIIVEEKQLEKKVDKKEGNVKVEKFVEYRIFYSDKLRDCKNLSDILDTYVKHTDSSQLLDDLRLRYISMYIFKTKISEEKLGVNMLKHLVNKRLADMSSSEKPKVEYISEQTIPDVQLNTERKINAQKRMANKTKDGDIEIQDDLFDGDLYSEIILHFKDTIAKDKELELDINIDRLVLLLFIHYDNEDIKSEIFIETLFRVIKDIQINKIITEKHSFKKYIEQRILNIKDITFWKENEERFYRSEVLIIGRNIMVKNKEFTDVIYNYKQGPIYIHSTPVNNNSLFNLNIDGSEFIVNKLDRDKIHNYIDSINDEILKEVDKEIDIIEKEINNATLELNTIVKNFLNIMPQTLFLNKDDYIAFEHLNSYNSFIAQQLLDRTVEQRDEIIDKLKEDNYLYTNTKEFIDENYIKLIKIAGRYINIPEKYHSSVIWKLIRNYYPEFISKHWENEYQIYFENNEALSSLSEYVDAYCRCPEISTKNVITVGKFTYYLMSKGMFPTDINGNFVQCNIQLIQEIFSKIEEIELEIFENKLTSTPVNNKDRYSINDVDLMNGYEFEQFVSYLFTKMGYTTEITKSSGDQGMDIIAEKGGNRIGIQSKCYSSKVTNKAVQEIFTALNHYNCSKGIVVTNNYFTDSAVELAQSNNIILWDRDILKSKIEEVFI